MNVPDVPDVYHWAFRDDDTGAEQDYREGQTSANKVLVGYCINPPCPSRRDGRFEMICGSPECASFVLRAPQGFWDGFLPIYVASLGLDEVESDDDEAWAEEESKRLTDLIASLSEGLKEEQLSQPDALEYVITPSGFFLFGVVAGITGGVMVALALAVAGMLKN